jgi:hypothetical protein
MATEKHTILYIMRSVHLDGRIFVNDKKVGVTGKGNATLKSRISQLSSTKNNFGAQCIAAWKVSECDENSALIYESKLHELLKNQMIPCANGGKIEWFYDDGSDQLDVAGIVAENAKNWKLDPVDVKRLQDDNAKELADKAKKASFDQVLEMVKALSNSHFTGEAITKSCVRFSTDDGRSFHINVRADLNKQYMSISKTCQDYSRYEKLCIENTFKSQISPRSGNLRVYVKSPREMAKVIDKFYQEGVKWTPKTGQVSKVQNLLIRIMPRGAIFVH